MNAASAMVVVTMGVLIQWGATSVSVHLERNCIGIKRTALVSVGGWLRSERSDTPVLQESEKAFSCVWWMWQFNNMDQVTPDLIRIHGLGYKCMWVREWAYVGVYSFGVFFFILEAVFLLLYVFYTFVLSSSMTSAMTPFPSKTNLEYSKYWLYKQGVIFRFVSTFTVSHPIFPSYLQSYPS